MKEIGAERVIISDDEWNTLMRIADHSHIDEWFCMCEDREGVFVTDLEDGSELDFRDALNMLADGIVEPTWEAIGQKYRKKFIELCDRFGVEFCLSEDG